jgi:hypothetical protein
MGVWSPEAWVSGALGVWSPEAWGSMGVWSPDRRETLIRVTSAEAARRAVVELKTKAVTEAASLPRDAHGLAGGLGRMMRMNWFTRFGAAVRAS